MGKTLVTGATGNIGSQVAADLLAAGVSVRVGIRDVSKGAALAEAGAEVVALDYDDPATLARAFAGVERAFLLTGFIETFLPHVEAAVAAASTAGASFVLRMSAIGADANGAPVGQQHGRAEDVVKSSGLDWAVLQPTFFQDNFATYQGASVRADGAFYGASAPGKMSYVSSSDVAAAAAAVLQAPDRHVGQTYVLTGGEALSDEEVAAVATKVAGRPIRYVNLEPEAFRQGLLSQGAPAWMADHMIDFEAVKANGWGAAVSPAVGELLGRSPERLEDFLTRNKALLG